MGKKITHEDICKKCSRCFEDIRFLKPFCMPFDVTKFEIEVWVKYFSRENNSVFLLSDIKKDGGFRFFGKKWCFVINRPEDCNFILEHVVIEDE